MSEGAAARWRVVGRCRVVPCPLGLPCSVPATQCAACRCSRVVVLSPCAAAAAAVAWRSELTRRSGDRRSSLRSSCSSIDTATPPTRRHTHRATVQHTHTDATTMSAAALKGQSHAPQHSAAHRAAPPSHASTQQRRVNAGQATSANSRRCTTNAARYNRRVRASTATQPERCGRGSAVRLSNDHSADTAR